MPHYHQHSSSTSSQTKTTRTKNTPAYRSSRRSLSPHRENVNNQRTNIIVKQKHTIQHRDNTISSLSRNANPHSYQLNNEHDDLQFHDIHNDRFLHVFNKTPCLIKDTYTNYLVDHSENLLQDLYKQVITPERIEILNVELRNISNALENYVRYREKEMENYDNEWKLEINKTDEKRQEYSRKRRGHEAYINMLNSYLDDYENIDILNRRCDTERRFAKRHNEYYDPSANDEIVYDYVNIINNVNSMNYKLKKSKHWTNTRRN